VDDVLLDVDYETVNNAHCCFCCCFFSFYDRGCVEMNIANRKGRNNNISLSTIYFSLSLIIILFIFFDKNFIKNFIYIYI